MLHPEDADMKFYSPDPAVYDFGTSVRQVADIDCDGVPDIAIGGVHPNPGGGGLPPIGITYFASGATGAAIYTADGIAPFNPWYEVVGDAEGDGDVDQADINIINRNMGRVSPLLTIRDGDFNHDHRITAADRTLAVNNFGANHFGGIRHCPPYSCPPTPPAGFHCIDDCFGNPVLVPINVWEFCDPIMCPNPGCFVEITPKPPQLHCIFERMTLHEISVDQGSGCSSVEWEFQVGGNQVLVTSPTMTDDDLAFQLVGLSEVRPHVTFSSCCSGLCEDEVSIISAWIDPDEDGVPSALEEILGLDPLKADSYGDGVLDGNRDYDGDGLSNSLEVALGFWPYYADSDGDGIGDGQENPQEGGFMGPGTGGVQPTDCSRYGFGINKVFIDGVEYPVTNGQSIAVCPGSNISLHVFDATIYTDDAWYIAGEAGDAQLNGDPDQDRNSPPIHIASNGTGDGTFYVGAGSVVDGMVCTDTVKINVVKVDLIPDPATHAPNATQATILPGDVEKVIATYSPDLTGQVWFTIENGSVAKFEVNGQLVTAVSATGSPQELKVLGTANGQTSIKVRRESQTGESCSSFPILVGGTIKVEYDRSPTFKVNWSSPPFPPDGGIAGGNDPPPAGPDEIFIGGLPVWPPLAESRQPISEDIINTTNAVAESVCHFRVTVIGADGQPKRGKRVVFGFKDGKLAIEGEVSVTTDADGRVERIMRSNMPGDTPRELGADKDNNLILVGKAAHDFVTNGLQPGQIANARINQTFTTHKFTGHSLKYEQTLTTTTGETYITSVSLDVPLINHTHDTILRNYLESQLYESIQGLQGQQVQIFDHFDEQGNPVFNPQALDAAPPESFPFHFTDIVDGTILPYTLQQLQDYYANHQPNVDFAPELGPIDPRDPPPGWTGKLVTVGAIAAEIGISMVPGGDLYDLFKEYFWKPFINGEPPDSVVGVISLVGFLADGGYLTGPFGAAANLVAGVVKCVFKFVPPGVVTAMIKMSGTALDSIKLLGDYIDKIPTPPGAGLIQSAAAKVEFLANQWAKIIYGPLNIAADQLSAAVSLVARRGSKSFTDEAMEGGAALVKAGKQEAAEHLFDEFASDVIESTFHAHRELAKRGIVDLSNDAIRGTGVAQKAVGTESGLVREIAQGTEVTAARAELVFSNLNKLENVEGLDEMILYLRNNATNTDGLDGVIFEGSVAAEIKQAELTLTTWDSQVISSGDLTRISNDGIPGLGKIDTMTSNWAVQIKHKTSVPPNFGVSELGGDAAATVYLQAMATQAVAAGKVPVFITNCPVTSGLADKLHENGIQWMQVIPQ